MSDLVERLRKRAEIRRQISTRKSVIEGKPDRISDLLEEAATEIETLKYERGVHYKNWLFRHQQATVLLENKKNAEERIKHLEGLARKRSDTIRLLLKEMRLADTKECGVCDGCIDGLNCENKETICEDTNE